MWPARLWPTHREELRIWRVCGRTCLRRASEHRPIVFPNTIIHVLENDGTAFTFTFPLDCHAAHPGKGIWNTVWAKPPSRTPSSRDPRQFNKEGEFLLRLGMWQIPDGMVQSCRVWSLVLGGGAHLLNQAYRIKHCAQVRWGALDTKTHLHMFPPTV